MTNRQCSTTCGTCYSAVTLSQYSPKEDPALVVTISHKNSCGMDNENCALKFVKKYPEGKEIKIYYNPTDYTDTTLSNDYDSDFYPTIIALGFFWGLPMAVALLYLLNLFYHIRKGNSEFGASSAPSKSTQAAAMELEFAPAAPPPAPASYVTAPPSGYSSLPPQSGYVSQPQQAPPPPQWHGAPQPVQYVVVDPANVTVTSANNM